MEAFAVFGPLAASVAIVAMFLKFQIFQKKENVKAEGDRLAALKDISDTCHTHSTQREERMITTIDKIEDTWRGNVEVQGRVLQTLDRLEERLKT